MEIEIEHVSGPSPFEKDAKIIVAVYLAGVNTRIYEVSITFGFDARILKLNDAEGLLPLIFLDDKSAKFAGNNDHPSRIIKNEYACLARVELSVVADNTDISDNLFIIKVKSVRLVKNPTAPAIHISSNMTLEFNPQKMNRKK